MEYKLVLKERGSSQRLAPTKQEAKEVKEPKAFVLRRFVQKPSEFSRFVRVQSFRSSASQKPSNSVVTETCRKVDTVL